MLKLDAHVVGARAGKGPARAGSGDVVTGRVEELRAPLGTPDYPRRVRPLERD